MKVFILMLLFLAQSPDDPENGPPEPGSKPAQCDNYKQTEPVHRCECGRAMQDCKGGVPDTPADVRMDKRCKTYCRAQHCECAGHGCRS